MKKSYHSVCAWTFNAGKGGFTPPDTRPAWSDDKLSTVGKIKLIKDKIASRLPSHIQLGFEMHYDYEYNEKNAAEVADALADTGISMAMATPGAHHYFAFGGICSPDPSERKAAGEYGQRSLDLAYGPLKKAWSKEVPPAFVVWNGSFGYDLASIGIQKMYEYLKQGIADICQYEAKKGGQMYIAIEPKPNEGHPCMMIPTVASAIVLWRNLNATKGLSLEKKGVNKEFGHSEMIGLDIIYDTVEEIDNNMLIHMHINSQGYSDGIILGGPGKYDIDHGSRVNGMNIAVAGLIAKARYNRWKGHDMQARAHDTEEQGIDRVVRSILSWDACEQAAVKINESELLKYLQKRETAKAEDVMRHAVVDAQKIFDGLYKA